MTTQFDRDVEALRERGGSHTEGPVTGLAPRSDGVEKLALDIVAELLGASPVTVGGQVRRKEHLDYIASKFRAHLRAQQPAWLDLKDEADEGQLHKDAGLHHSARKCVCGKWHLQEDAAPQLAVDVDALALVVANKIFGPTEQDSWRHIQLAEMIRAHLAPAPGVVEAAQALVASEQVRDLNYNYTARTCIFCHLTSPHDDQHVAPAGHWPGCVLSNLMVALRQAQGAE